eukprot:gene5470-biopygen17728
MNPFPRLKAEHWSTACGAATAAVDVPPPPKRRRAPRAAGAAAAKPAPAPPGAAEAVAAHGVDPGDDKMLQSIVAQREDAKAPDNIPGRGAEPEHRTARPRAPAE